MSVEPNDARLRVLADLVTGNARGLNEIRTRGVGLDTTRVRLDALVEAIFTPEDRLEFEMLYEGAVKVQIEMARRKLLVAPLGAKR